MSWAEVQKIKEACGIAPSFVKAPIAKKIDVGYQISWNDPDDTVIENQLLCTWSATKILRKQGSYPAHAFDGSLVVNNRVRNAYMTEPFIDEVVGENWFYKAFPISSTDAISNNDRNNFVDKPAVLYGVRVDKFDANALTCVTYLFDAIGFVPVTNAGASLGSWVDAWFIRDLRLSAVMLTGERAYDLNPANVTQKVGGAANDYNNAAFLGNFMSGIPTVYWRMDTSEQYIFIYYSNEMFEGANCWAHRRADNTIAAYKYISITAPNIVTRNSQTILATYSSTGVYIKFPTAQTFSALMSALATTDPDLSIMSRQDTDLIFILNVLVSKRWHFNDALGISVLRSNNSTSIFSNDSYFYLKGLSTYGSTSYISGLFLGGSATRPRGDGMYDFIAKALPPYTESMVSYEAVPTAPWRRSLIGRTIIADVTGYWFPKESGFYSDFTVFAGMLFPKVTEANFVKYNYGGDIVAYPGVTHAIPNSTGLTVDPLEALRPTCLGVPALSLIPDSFPVYSTNPINAQNLIAGTDTGYVLLAQYSIEDGE